jgi:methyl-CpG-binding domain protein 4
MQKTPVVLSPYVLLQELLRDEPWKLLVACIMLNQTTAVAVKKVIWSFFDRWPDAESCAKADSNDIRDMLKFLGMQNRRTKYIQSLSLAFSGNDYGSVLDLPGVGKYAHDSYRMFVEGFLVEDVKDKELKNYLKWAQENVRQENKISRVP